MKKAYFAGGCFWCSAFAYSGRKGVIKVTSGYSGGKEENPIYEDVKAQKTGHRETICIEYDESIISFIDLLDIFFKIVDPFDGGGQFVDRGRSYTLAVYYQDELEKSICEQRISKLEKDSGKKVYISLEPFDKFFVAEDYHQDYHITHKEEFEQELITSKRKPVKCAVIWDLDGTLIDSYKFIVPSIIEVAKKHGVILTKDEVSKEVIATSVIACLGNLSKKTNVSLETLLEEYREHNRKSTEEIELIEGAKETLKALKERDIVNFLYTHRGVTTNEVLSRLGIKEFFTDIVSGTDGFKRKPSGEALEHLVKKYNLDKNVTYYVGDRNIDIECAKNAGVKGILFIPKGSFCDSEGLEDIKIDNLLEILNKELNAIH